MIRPQALRRICLKKFLEHLFLKAANQQPTAVYGFIKDVQHVLGVRYAYGEIQTIAVRLERDGYLASKKISRWNTGNDYSNHQAPTLRLYQLTENGRLMLAEYEALLRRVGGFELQEASQVPR